MSSSSNEAMIFVVISFLAVALIFGSISAFNAFAKPNSTKHCATTNYNSNGGTTQTCCWVDANDQGWCQECDYDANNNVISCKDQYKARSVPTGISGPGRLGSVLPSSGNNASTAPPSLQPSQPSLAGQQPQTQQTTSICPNGLAPDANGNCPPPLPTKSQQASPSSQNLGNLGSNNKGSISSPSSSSNDNNNPSTPRHHHKGSS